MAQDSAELFVAGSGNIYAAPFGTTLPNDFEDILDASFVDLGYLTEDGYRFVPDIEKTDLYGWQSSSPLRTVITKRSITLSLDFMQSNEDVVQLYFGGGDFTGSVYTPPEASDVDERSIVADVFDGERQWRFWFSKMVVSATREVGFTRATNAVWGIDLTALKVDASTPLFGFDSGGDAEFPPGSGS